MATTHKIIHNLRKERKKMKKIFSYLLITVMIGSAISNVEITKAQDTHESPVRVYSPENPGVEFDEKYLDLKNIDVKVEEGKVVCDTTDIAIQEEFDEILSESDELEGSIIESIQDSKQLVGIITVTAGVEEVYQNVGGKPVCVSSELVSPFDNDDILNQTISPYTNTSFVSGYGTQTSIGSGYETKGNLVLSFGVYKTTPTSYASEYYLMGIADWTNGLIAGENTPANGDDYLGLYWGGNFASKDKNITIQVSNGSLKPDLIKNSSYLAGSSANKAVVYGFTEFIAGERPSTLDIAAVSATLYKNTLTGNGNETTFSAKYIHTYQSTVGSITISNPSGFTLSSCDKQWSLVAEVDEIKY